MNNFNNGFDPIDEYASIEVDTNKEDTPTSNISQPVTPQPANVQTPPPYTVQQPNPYVQPMPPQAPPAYQYMRPNPPVYPQPPQQPQYPVYPQYQTYNNPNTYAPYNQNPYMVTPQFDKPKEKLPTKAKVYIGVMTGLMLFFLIALFVSCSSTLPKPKKNNNEHPLKQYATEPDSDYNSIPSFNYDGTYIEEDITLFADEGHTQQKDINEDNVYPPKKDAKELKSKDLPKDKDDKKYTTQYAYQKVTDSVVSIVCYNGKISDKEEDIISEGTGTIITSDGYIVTNSHVIGDSYAYTINVILNNHKEYKAKIVGFDSRSDLAVLKIDAKDLQAVSFANSDKTEVGQDIVAIGNPGGTSFQNSLTKGIVSAVERELAFHTNVKYIQIDAAINPGNSGGPLCNIYGQVIGINTAKISDTAYEGMGFAIEGNKVLEIVNDLIHYGYVQDRVRLGLVGLEVNAQMAYTYGLPYGIMVTDITKDGPLDGTGIETYDIITAINGKKVSTFADVYSELELYAPGDEVTLTIYRMKY